MATNVPVTLDTLIVIKVFFQGNNKRFKIPLRDLGAQVLPDKLRTLLQLQPDDEVVFERYSDSAGAYVTLDSDKPQVYKTLFRAAKAKLKLRLRATLAGEENEAPAPPAILESPWRPITGREISPTADVAQLQAILSQASPVIAHSPVPVNPRSSYKQPEVETEVEPEQVSPISPVMPTKEDVEDEAPVPRSFTARQSFFSNLAAAHNADLALRSKEIPRETPQCSWVVFCNNCNHSMEDQHFHCSICDDGDYDLCPSCVDAGIHCPGAGHWMVKRFVKNGCVVNSTTERVGPKSKPQSEQEMPGAFTDEKQPVEAAAEEATRTCNSCVKVLPEQEFITCSSCEDYDLCMECHTGNKHGHHPAHAFEPVASDITLPALAAFLCNAGRNVRHSAVCDGCDKFIYGVRHKCLNCPDWDFCSDCMKNAKFIHPRHRFVPIYEPLAEPISTGARHYGIYCDGPLCKDKENLSYIEGARYKCAVCHDTDFCANCEAHPSNKHNASHPLIQLKSPIRGVSVTTMNNCKDGSLTRLGDHATSRSMATETAPVAPPSANAATQVQTIVDMKPTEVSQPKTTKEKIEIRDLLTEPLQEKITVQDLLSAPAVAAPEVTIASRPETESSKKSEELAAEFIRDTIPDGSQIGAGLNFVQVWTLRNPGPSTWPAGCSVRHVGGDNMLNIDNTRPLSQSELSEASESNVIGRPVEPNEEISFRVVMKAPSREGTAISYWRLKAADGTPFGHRLWCDIQVVPSTVPSPFTSPAPMPAPYVPANASPSSDKTEPSSSSGNLNMTPHERWQQSKMERLRVMQRVAQTHRARQAEKARGDEAEQNSARLHEEALERLRKMKLNLDEKREQTRLHEKMEREKMLRVQKVRKLAVERLLENRRQDTFFGAVQKDLSREEPKPEVDVKQETAELPVEEKPVEAQGQSSGMIFPQLDKESPASSTHEAISTKPDIQEVDSENTTVAAPSEPSDEEFFEDAESVDIRSISSDEGFLTDEEYDILDASDEEMP